MKTILGILLLAVLALAGYRKSFIKLSPVKSRGSFFLTGTEFILVGYVLSDSFLGILDADTLTRIRPFLILGLGWIGLLSGLQLEWNSLKVFSRSSYFWVLGNSCCILVLVSSGLYAFFSVMYASEPHLGLVVAVLAVAALSTAQAPLALWIQNLPRQKRPQGIILQFVASLNDVLAICLFGILVGFYSSRGTWEGIPLYGWEKLLFSLLLGILMGVLFIMLFRARLAEADKVLVLIGLVLFGCGVTYLLRISPLLVYLLAGAILANFSLKSEETFQLLLRIERPLYLIFLMIAGAYLELSGLRVVMIAAVYVVLRALAQGMGGRLFLGRIFPGSTASPSGNLGWGLISQAGIAVALAVHFRLWIADFSALPLFRTTFSILLLAILFNELLSPIGLSLAGKEK